MCLLALGNINSSTHKIHTLQGSTSLCSPLFYVCAWRDQSRPATDDVNKNHNRFMREAGRGVVSIIKHLDHALSERSFVH